MHNKNFVRTTILALLGLSLSSLSILPEPTSRTVACLPAGSSGGLSGGPLSLSGDLISQVKDEALRESARDWYNYLTVVELNSLNQRQAMRTQYGLKSPLFGTAQDYAIPALIPMSANPVHGASGGLFAPPAQYSFAGPGGFGVNPSLNVPNRGGASLLAPRFF